MFLVQTTTYSYFSINQVNLLINFIVKIYKIFVEFYQIYVIFNFERILSKIHPKAKAIGFLFDEECKNVDRQNRKSQQQFCCQHCGYTANADYNASINIRQRYISNVLKQKLHLFDQFGRLIPKKLKKEKIKEIILDYS